MLAASICTRGGKAVLARAFHDIKRSRVEALLASFPKAANSGTQHTTVEQDNVRFVYQPLDELYMVLITNKQSNILQDIDTLHLFAQVVTNTCRTLEEREILRNAYELISAFDEIINLGYRENLTINQIKTFLEMESHEERIQEIIARVRIDRRRRDRRRTAADCPTEQGTGGYRRAQEESQAARDAAQGGQPSWEDRRHGRRPAAGLSILHSSCAPYCYRDV